jgi:hypothetical protein
MSSGFVSGGSLDKPNERDEEWLKAQRELEEERTRKAQLEQQQGGKSLFEILQANKGWFFPSIALNPYKLTRLTWQAWLEAAKQDAFEEVCRSPA